MWVRCAHTQTHTRCMSMEMTTRTLCECVQWWATFLVIYDTRGAYKYRPLIISLARDNWKPRKRERESTSLSPVHFEMLPTKTNTPTNRGDKLSSSSSSLVAICCCESVQIHPHTENVHHQRSLSLLPMLLREWSTHIRRERESEQRSTSLHRIVPAPAH